MSAHALLSPSSASRWLNCPPSARLEATLPESTSAYADEGTLAHRLGELLIKKDLGLIRKPEYKKQLAAVQANDLYEDSMLDYCADYATLILETFQAAKAEHADAIIYLEQRFSLEKYIPESFGTSDVVIIAGNTLHVNDLKYGKGVPVASENNKQMMLYALGAYLEFAYAYDIDTVRMTIIQPRIDNTSTWEMPVADLLAWADLELKQAAQLAHDGEGEFKAGAHCQFCRARSTCRANYDMQMQLAAHEFADVTADPPLITDEEVADILSRAKLFEGWLTSVKEFALDQALNHGKTWPGYKLVEGRSNRKYADEAKVIETLEANNYAREDFGRFKVFGITELEKSLGKKTFTDLLSPLIVKPQGKATLVPDDDKRPVFNSVQQAVDDFKDN